MIAIPPVFGSTGILKAGRRHAGALAIVVGVAFAVAVPGPFGPDLAGAAGELDLDFSAIGRQTGPQTGGPDGAGAAQNPAAAQSSESAEPDAARRRAQAAELEAIRRAIEVSQSRQADLRTEIGAIEADRERLAADLISTAERLRDVEIRIRDAEIRLARLHEKENAVRRSLGERRVVLAEILAALQRIGRTPPPVILSRPDDAVAAIRGSALAGALLPELRSEAEALANDLDALTDLGREIEAGRERLKVQYAALGEEEARIDILIETRARQEHETQAALLSEQNKAARLAAEAQSLNALIEKLENNVESASKAAAKARRLPGKADAAEAIRRFSDATRLAPAVRFVDAKGLLPLPVVGAPVLSFGQDDGLGGQARGLSLEATPGARVVAPADGWVVYAGPFRSFGQVLIVNAGDGYHIVLAGMERIDATLGQFVLAGEPVAIMGSRQLASLGDVEHTSAKAILYVEFRKDGKAINPAPWWDDRAEKEGRG